MEKLTVSRIITLFSIFLISVGIAKADIYMKYKNHFDAVEFMGKQMPARDIVEETWITERGFRTDNPASSVIVLPEEKKVVMMNHKDKIYTEMSMDIEEMISTMIPESKKKEDDKAFQEMMKKMREMMKIDVSVQTTDEQKKIRDWNCRKYILSMKMAMVTITNEVWATQDLKVPDKKLYTKFSSAMIAQMPTLQRKIESEVMKEIEKIKGVFVQSISTQKSGNQTVKSTTELLEFKEGNADDDLLKVPSDYEKKEMGGKKSSK